MSNKLSTEERTLLHLLKSALTGGAREPEPGCMDVAAWRRVLAIADAHAVLPLLYPVLDGLVPRELYARSAEICAGQYYHLLFLTRYYVNVLAARGIRTVVLKGPGASAAYPTPEYRKSGDVDLLLLDRDRLADAMEAVEATGAAMRDEQHANHHLSYRTPEGITLELHITLAEEFDNRAVNRWIASLQDDMAAHAVTLEALPGVSVPVPDIPRQAMSLMLHMLQHFLRAGFGLKLLCDWAVFWNAPRAPDDAAAYLRLAESCGITGFSALVTGVCVRYLGLDPQALPFTEDGELCGDFMREIFDAEEFGRTSAQRMVMVRGGVTGYVREFHHPYHKSLKIQLQAPDTLSDLPTLIATYYDSFSITPFALVLPPVPTFLHPPVGLLPFASTIPLHHLHYFRSKNKL